MEKDGRYYYSFYLIYKLEYKGKQVNVKKQKGFEGQKMIVLPQSIIDLLEKTPLTSPLHVTDIGYFPKAEFHYRNRPQGCKQFILVYCTEGAGWFKVNDREYSVSSNDFFILPPNVHHSYGTDENNPWSIYWMHFKGDNAEYLSQKINVISKIYPLKFGVVDYRIQLFEEIYQTLDNGYSQDNLEYASMCLWHFLSSFVFVNHFKHVLYDKNNDAIEQSIRYFKENIAKNITLKEAASLSGYSSSHYSYLFKKKTGYAPLEYFVQLKIQRACQFLDLTDMRINEVALQVGFEDPYYFSRQFSKVMNISPNKYKKRLKG